MAYALINVDRDDEAKIVIQDWNKACMDYHIPNIFTNHLMPQMVDLALKVGLMVIQYKLHLRLQLQKDNYEDFCQVAEESDKQSHLWKLKHCTPHIFEKICSMVVGRDLTKFFLMYDNVSAQVKENIIGALDRTSRASFFDILDGIKTWDNGDNNETIKIPYEKNHILQLCSNYQDFEKGNHRYLGFEEYIRKILNERTDESMATMFHLEL